MSGPRETCSREPLCFLPGHCADTNYDFESGVDTAEECLALCQEDTDRPCAYMSYFVESSQCRLYDTCDRVEKMTGVADVYAESTCQAPGAGEIDAVL